jgi:hypothetical protein
MNVTRLRLTNQGIASPRFTEPGNVVAWLGALQAQDYPGALWSIGLRLAGATEQDVEAAIANRAIVRTWPMRGTLHFVAAQDVRWLLALLTPRMIAQSAGRYRQLELDEMTFGRSKDVAAKTLQGGRQLTRDALLQALQQAGIATDGQRGYHILVRLAQDGLICFGERSGKQHTFALLDEWIAPASPLAREAALGELARRYYASHGPATAQDLMRWAGITHADVQIGLAAAGQDLIQASSTEGVCWMASAMPAPGDSDQSVHLLPGFDEYILGYGDRSAVLDPAHASRICPGGNGVFNPTLVIDGRVAGVWKRTLKKDTVTVEVAPFRPLLDAESDALRAAANRYSAFLGASHVRIS